MSELKLTENDISKLSTLHFYISAFLPIIKNQLITTPLILSALNNKKSDVDKMQIIYDDLVNCLNALHYCIVINGGSADLISFEKELNKM